MQLKQLKYFLVAEKTGSFNKAALELYTTQPNVSKVISNLERDLGYSLFIRSKTGLSLTEKGIHAKKYAESMLELSENIYNIEEQPITNSINVSTYRSNMISHILVDMHKQDNNNLKINHKQGSVEKIINDVKLGESELGVIFISTDQLQSFNNIIGAQNLKFMELANKETCLFVGPQNQLYDEEEVSIEQLKELTFIRGTEDYFSIEENLEPISLGPVETTEFNFEIFTNSDHLYMDALMRTNLCSLGIDFFCPSCQHTNIKSIKIKGAKPYLTIGYITEKNIDLSVNSSNFINLLQNRL